jgi:hypothetical protein
VPQQVRVLLTRVRVHPSSCEYPFLLVGAARGGGAGAIASLCPVPVWYELLRCRSNPYTHWGGPSLLCACALGFAQDAAWAHPHCGQGNPANSQIALLIGGFILRSLLSLATSLLATGHPVKLDCPLFLRLLCRHSQAVRAV